MNTVVSPHSPYRRLYLKRSPISPIPRHCLPHWRTVKRSRRNCSKRKKTYSVRPESTDHLVWGELFGRIFELLISLGHVVNTAYHVFIRHGYAVRINNIEWISVIHYVTVLENNPSLRPVETSHRGEKNKLDVSNSLKGTFRRSFLQKRNLVS